MWPTMELYSKNMKRYLKNSLTKIQTKESVLISHSLSIGFNIVSNFLKKLSGSKDEILSNKYWMYLPTFRSSQRPINFDI